MGNIWENAWALGGIALSGGSVFALLRFTRDWGERGQSIRDCVTGIGAVGEKFDAFTKMVSNEHKEITRRLDQNEYILTGDEGVNGIRGEIRNIKQTLFDQNEARHTEKAKLFLWQQAVDVALDRRKNPPRRKNPGRRSTDK